MAKLTVQFSGLLVAAFVFSISAWSQENRDTPDDAGRWRRYSVPDQENLTPEQREQLEALDAIGYLDGSAEAGDIPSGTIRHDSADAQNGLNFYTSGHAPEAVLTDMAGNVLHRWHCDFDRAFPNASVPKRHTGRPFWRRAHLYPNGDVLAVFEGLGIIKVDRNSTVLWANANGAHHDLDVASNGDIWVLTLKLKVNRKIHPEDLIREDFITVLNPQGKEKRSFSLVNALYESDYAGYMDGRARETGDIFHTNTLELLEGVASGRAPEFKKGNILTSMCFLHTIAVVNPETKRVVWAHSGDYRLQHEPTILENGNLLLFDNRGKGETSRVIEYRLPEMEKVWVYGEASENRFYTPTCGTARRLANGNTLIVESDNGRAFEVTSDKAIVWEFVNPHRAGDEKQYIATLFDLERIPVSYVAAWLKHEAE